jgi:hypothetical protein
VAEHQVARFIEWARRQENYRKGFGPKALRDFLNEHGAGAAPGRRPEHVGVTPMIKKPQPPLDKPTMTPQQTAAEAGKLAALLSGIGKGGEA